jgi:hypothetical protein
VAAAFLLLRPSHLKRLAEEDLAERLNLEVTVEQVSIRFLPRPEIRGTGLVLRIPERPDLPPFIAIDHFSAEIGPFSLVRKQIDTVHVGGLKIAVPPSGSRGALDRDLGDGEPRVIVKHLVTHDGELKFVPRRAEDRPLIFTLHDLSVHDVGLGTRMPFEVTLVNPVPKGLVQAQGSVGPWKRDDVSQMPVGGDYTFTDADLATINGIGGILASVGTFSGRLTAIDVRGAADVPEFSLDLGGRLVPLATTFQAVVDGTNGTTVLNRVDATLFETPMVVTGAITNLAGPAGHQVDLRVQIEEGRIEDLLALVIESPTPVMTGDVSLDAELSLPPGPTRVRDRLSLAGRFGLTRTRFTDRQVQSRLQELSRRSQGKDAEGPVSRVLTDLSGQVAIASGRARLTGVSFRVPGARVQLSGSYALASGALDLRGTLRMQASVSQAVGGFKSIFIRPFDRLFRKDGAGAVVPIRISGTRRAPKFSVEFGKVF